jgi:hypothetical protein
LPRARIQACKAAQGFAVVNDHRLDEEVLAGEKELPAGLRRGDRCSRHQFRDLPDGVGAEAVVVEVVGHGDWLRFGCGGAVHSVMSCATVVAQLM